MRQRFLNARGYTMVISSALLFGSYGIWAHYMGGTFGPFYQAWVRGILIMAMLLPILLISRGFRWPCRKDAKWLALCLGCSILIHASSYYAFVVANMGTVTLIFYASLVLVSYAVGYVWLKEKITRAKVAAMCLALAGLALVAGVSLMQFSLLGITLAMVAGAAAGGEVAISKKLPDYSPLLITFWSWLLVVATHLPLSLMLGEVQYLPALNVQWLALAAYAIAACGGFGLVIAGFKYVDASTGSLIGLSEVVFGMLFGVWLFHEPVTPAIVWGMVAIMLAAVLPDIMALQRSRRSARHENATIELQA